MAMQRLQPALLDDFCVGLALFRRLGRSMGAVWTMAHFKGLLVFFWLSIYNDQTLHSTTTPRRAGCACQCHCAFAALLKLYPSDAAAAKPRVNCQTADTPVAGHAGARPSASGASPAAAARSETCRGPGRAWPAERADAASDCGPRESPVSSANSGPLACLPLIASASLIWHGTVSAAR